MALASWEVRMGGTVELRIILGGGGTRPVEVTGRFGAIGSCLATLDGEPRGLKEVLSRSCRIEVIR